MVIHFSKKAMLILWIIPLLAQALDLSKTELFNRCYSQLTDTKLNPKDDRLVLISSGQLDPIVACMNLLLGICWGYRSLTPWGWEMTQRVF